MGNQWEHCGTGATCDSAEVVAQDVRLADGAIVDLGTPDGARAGTPVLARVAPARPRAGELVRVFGDNFNAVEGTACAGETAPVDPCSGDNPAVQQQNQAANANRIRIQTADGTLLQTLYPDAVTPTMLAFRMPFDCFAPLTLQISKRSPDDSRSSASIILCAPDGCAGQPAGLPCDDRNACTSDDRCTGGDDGVCAGDVVVCQGDCLTGTCDPASGCVPKAASAPCDDANACTMGDHCSGGGDVCIAGPARTCDGGCATGRCDPVAGCETKPQSSVCRPTAGDCDVAEVCDGLSTECPPDGFLGSSTVCRPAAGACDLAEACTGTSASCPLDRFRPSGTMCRDAAGVCDEPETCSGVSSSCPADAYRPAGALCRGAQDACDVAEVCSGQSRECPPDGLKTGCDETACVFERPLACSDPAVPVAITRPFDQARRRVAVWALGCAQGASPRPTLLKKAAVQLARARKRIERAVNGRRISAGCAGALQGTVDDAARRVQNALGS
jgi:hypothetical protein